jgi:hypothetical protein
VSPLADSSFGAQAKRPTSGQANSRARARMNVLGTRGRYQHGQAIEWRWRM